MGALREESGKVSASRTVLWFSAGLITAAWIGVGVYIFVGSVDAEVWSRFQGWITWGRDFFFVSVIPYVSNKVADGIKSARAGGD